MKYKLAVFDMDGTILYTLQDLTDGLNHALRKNGFPEKKLTEVRSFVGNGIRHEVECSVPADTKKEMIQKVYEDFNAWYEVHCFDHTKPYEGILSLLQDLRKAGMKTAVVSNKGDYAVQELDRKFFQGLLDCGVGEKENIARKPAPDTVNEVLKELQISKTDAVYIGDSKVDLRTAENAGMPCIIVTWGYRDEEDLRKQGAQTIVRTVEELKHELLG